MIFKNYFLLKLSRNWCIDSKFIMDRLIKSMKPGKIVALHRINAAHAEYIQMRD